MISSRDEELLKSLPPDVEAPMRLALSLSEDVPAAEPLFAKDAYPGLKVTSNVSAPRDLDEPLRAAFEAAQFPPYAQTIPLAETLSPPQRALAELVASRADMPLHRFAIPQTAWARRRWLGMDPPSVLERHVDYEVEGQARSGPLWLAMKELDDDEEQMWPVLEKLSLVERMDAVVQLAFGPYRGNQPGFDKFEMIDDSLGDWAENTARWLSLLFQEGSRESERNHEHEPPYPLGWLVFLALARAKRDASPEWDWMLPCSFGEMAPLTVECASVLPEPRRGSAIARSLSNLFPRQALRAGMELVTQLPSLPIVEHLIARSHDCISSIGCPPRREWLRGLADALVEHPGVQKLVTEHLAGLPALPKLRIRSVSYVKKLEDLTPGQRTMFGVLGAGWEGDQGPLVTKNEQGEPVFHSFDYVSAYELEDESGTSRYEALLYMDEDGAVCETGTTHSVAYVSQMSLRCNQGDELMEAFQELLRVRPARE